MISFKLQTSHFRLPLAFLLLTAAACQQPSAPKLTYPATRKGDVVEDYHGTRVADPYRWMEDLDSKEVADWVAAENRVTEAELGRMPMRKRFTTRITELWNYPKTGLPEREGGRYFYAKNSGLERQAPVYVRASLTSQPALVLDPNAISADGGISLAQWEPSPDGKLLAYGLSEGGADWETLHVREVDRAKDFADEVRWVRFSEIAWTKDSQGFFYSRYPEPPAGKVLEAALSGQMLYYHRVGTSQAADTLVYERKDLPTWFITGQTTEDGRYLLISLAKGSDNNNRLYYADLGNPVAPAVTARITPIVEADDAEFNAFGNAGTLLYLRTDRDTPNRKVIAIDVNHPEPSAWRTVVPEAREAIEAMRLVGGRIVVQYLVDVQSRLSIFGRDGAKQGEVTLPGTGTVAALGGRADSPEILFTYSSPLFPTTVFAYDPAAQTRTAFEAPTLPIDTAQFETKAMFATSRDGTRIPFFLTARKNLALDGSHPTMVYGYGGFSISTLPTYRADVPAWLEAGGIWVTANMRGGAEYGEAWHKAGRLELKQNVFDDFIAVAEHLVKEKYTTPARLGIMGGSNGGLLVGAVEEQRPDLFAVAWDPLESTCRHASLSIL